MQQRWDVEYNRTTDWPQTLAVVRDYWLSRCGDRLMPARKDIVPSHLKAQLPELLLVDVVDGGADFRYRLVGTGLTQFFTCDPTGQLMSRALAPYGSVTVEQTIESYGEIVRRRAPARITTSGAAYGQGPKLLDAWMGPLSSDGEHVDAVLSSFMFVWDSEHEFHGPTGSDGTGSLGLGRARKTVR